MSHILPAILAGALPALAIVAALKDLTSYTIPNWISVALVLAFFALALVTAMPLGVVGAHVLVGAAALFAGMGLFALGWAGGGDAKLLAAACLWLGWPGTEAFLLDTVIAGGLLAVILLAARQDNVRALIPSSVAWISRLITPGEPAPYGVAIALGVLAVLPASELIPLIHTSY